MNDWLHHRTLQMVAERTCCKYISPPGLRGLGGSRRVGGEKGSGCLQLVSSSVLRGLVQPLKGAWYQAMLSVLRSRCCHHYEGPVKCWLPQKEGAGRKPTKKKKKKNWVCARLAFPYDIFFMEKVGRRGRHEGGAHI